MIFLFKGDPGADGPDGEPGPLVCVLLSSYDCGACNILYRHVHFFVFNLLKYSLPNQGLPGAQGPQGLSGQSGNPVSN